MAVWCECGAIGDKHEVTTFNGNELRTDSSEETRVVHLHFHEYALPSTNGGIDLEFDYHESSMMLSYIAKQFENTLLNQGFATIKIKNVSISVSKVNNDEDPIYEIKVDDNKGYKLVFRRNKTVFDKFFERISECCRWAEMVSPNYYKK